MKYHCTPRGLCQFFNAGQIGDNDARFDPIQGNNGNQSLRGRLESPDVNAFLVMDARSLAKMAEELGQTRRRSRGARRPTRWRNGSSIRCTSPRRRCSTT